MNLAVALWDRAKATGSDVATLARVDAVFRAGIALWPTARPTLTGDHVRLVQLYGNYLQERGRGVEAVPHYERVARWLEQYPALAPEVNADFHVWYGAALEARGDADGALAQYQRALQRRPEWIVPLRNIGQLLMTRARPRTRSACYRRAIAAEPTFAVGYVNLGLCLSRLSRRDEALEVLASFGTAVPESAENVYYRATSRSTSACAMMRCGRTSGPCNSIRDARTHGQRSTR